MDRGVDMSKRFTDTEKWDRPWYRKLPVQYKMLFLFILDKCDIAGIWYVDFDTASYYIGSTVCYEDSLQFLEKQITVLNNGSKWFVHDYIGFQCGKLNTAINFHRSILQRLRENDVTLPLGLVRGEGQGQGKGKGKGKTIYIGGVHFEQIWTLYPSKIGKKRAENYFYSSVQTEEDFEKMKIALENYKRSERVKNNFIQNASTWFNNWRDWVDDPTNEGEKQKLRSTTKSVDAHIERMSNVRVNS